MFFPLKSLPGLISTNFLVKCEAWEMKIVFFFLFNDLGFYGPFKNISLISSRSFIKGGRKQENPGKNPGKNHLTIRKQLGFPRDLSETRTTAVRNLMD